MSVAESRYGSHPARAPIAILTIPAFALCMIVMLTAPLG